MYSKGGKGSVFPREITKTLAGGWRRRQPEDSGSGGGGRGVVKGPQSCAAAQCSTGGGGGGAAHPPDIIGRPGLMNRSPWLVTTVWLAATSAAGYRKQCVFPSAPYLPMFRVKPPQPAGPRASQTCVATAENRPTIGIAAHRQRYAHQIRK